MSFELAIPITGGLGVNDGPSNNGVRFGNLPPAVLPSVLLTKAGARTSDLTILGDSSSGTITYSDITAAAASIAANDFSFPNATSPDQDELLTSFRHEAPIRELILVLTTQGVISGGAFVLDYDNGTSMINIPLAAGAPTPDILQSGAVNTFIHLRFATPLLRSLVDITKTPLPGNDTRNRFVRLRVVGANVTTPPQFGQLLRVHADAQDLWQDATALIQPIDNPDFSSYPPNGRLNKGDLTVIGYDHWPIKHANRVIQANTGTVNDVPVYWNGTTFADAPAGFVSDPSNGGRVVTQQLFWFRPDALSAGLMDTWPDVAGTAQNAIGTGTGRPTVVMDAINGLPAVQFDGSNDELVVRPGPWNAGITIFILAKMNEVLDDYGGFMTNRSTNSTQWFSIGHRSIGTLALETSMGITIEGPVISNQTVLISATFSAGAQALFLNGASVGSSSRPSIGLDSQVLRLGTWLSSTQGLLGQLGEVIVYSTQLPADERQRIEGYLAWKFGVQTNLPASHPWANTRAPRAVGSIAHQVNTAKPADAVRAVVTTHSITDPVTGVGFHTTVTAAAPRPLPGATLVRQKSVYLLGYRLDGDENAQVVSSFQTFSAQVLDPALVTSALKVRAGDDVKQIGLFVASVDNTPGTTTVALINPRTGEMVVVTGELTIAAPALNATVTLARQVDDGFIMVDISGKGSNEPAGGFLFVSGG
jgi:hypothetical protein